MRRALLFLLLFHAASAAAADVALKNPAEEARAQALFYEIRCVVCAGEPVAESQATVAMVIRRYIRSRIAAGASDAEIKKELADRYGETILATPPFDAATWILWLGPLLMLIGLGGAAAFYYRKRAGSAG